MAATQRRAAVSLLALTLLASSPGLFVSAQAPQDVGTWSLAGAVGDGRSGAASVALGDGTTLMAGGILNGSPTASVLLYDPAMTTLVAAGQLAAARVGHTMTPLEDGRVLVIGGRIGEAPSGDVELFDPVSGTSVVIGQLAAPRAGHAAVRIAPGVVAVFGGASGDAAALNTVEHVNAATGSTTAGSNPMRHPRVGASATMLIDGRVLVAGGNDGSADLDSAELYYPWTQGFEPASNRLTAPRSGHSAILLPHNGGVLIAGGSSNGAALATADLFLPAASPDPFSFGINTFVATAAMAGGRVGAAAGPGRDGYAWIDGGGIEGSETYRFATIKTDKDDYAPGEQAVITGSGWMPGEEVRLLFQEYPAVHDDYELTVVADAAGNIHWDQWAPEQHDIGVRFYLLAYDSRSRAQITFTDGNLSSNIVFNIAPLSVAAGGVLNWSATARCENGGGPNTCDSEGYVAGDFVQNGYEVLVQRATDAAFTANLVTVGTATTTNGVVNGTTTAPASGGPYFYRARHNNQNLPNVPVRGSAPNNSWQPASSNAMQVTLLTDVTAPTTTLTVGTPTFGAGNRFVTGATTFTLGCTDNAGGTGCAATFYQIVAAANACPSNADEAAWVSYSAPFTLPAPDGEVRVCYFSRDTIPNRETVKSQLHVRDTVAPETTATATANAASYTSGAWTRFDVTLELHAADGAGEAGVKEIIYSASGATTIAPTTVTGASASVPAITAEGTTTVTFFAVDNVGNTEASKTFTVQIDKTAPAIVDLGPTTSANAAGWYMTDVTNRFSVTDALSGLGATCLAAFPEVGGQNIQSKTTTGQGLAVMASSDTCTDVAGNTATAVTSASFKIDKIAPTIVQLDFSPAANGAGWHRTDVTVRFAATDVLSGLGGTCMAFLEVSGERIQEKSITGEGTGLTTTSDSCTDVAGNTAAALTSTEFRIDRTAPVIVNLGPLAAPNSNGWYNADITNRFGVTDGLSGLDAACQVAFPAVVGGRIQSKTSSGEGSAVMVASDSCADVAGNTASGVEAGPFSIDKTAPLISDLGPTSAPNADAWYNTDVTNRFSVTELLSGVDMACQTAFPLVGSDRIQSRTTTGEGMAVSVTSTGCADLAGNAAAVATSAAFRIDKTAPAVAILSPTSGNTIVLSIASNGTANDGLSGIKTVTLNNALVNYNGSAQTWATVSNVNLVCGANTLTAVATDYAGLTSSASVAVTRLCFTFEYLRPLEQSYVGGPTVVNDGKYGRVIPVKGIVRQSGVALSDADLAGLGLTLRIGVNGVACTGAAITDAVEEYSDAGNSNGGTNIFRWTLDGFWVYNLDTKTPPGVPMAINNCYRLDAYVQDAALNKVRVSESPYAIFKPVK